MKNYRESHKEHRIAEQYEQVVYQKGSYDDMLWRWEQGVLRREITELVKTTPHTSLLDFATGTGRIVAFLEDMVSEAVGVDNAEAMLEKAQRKVTKAELLAADITENDVLRDRRFDVITAFRFFLNAQPELRDSALRVLVQKLRDEHSLFIFNIHGNTWSHRAYTKLWFWLRGRRLNTLSYRQARRMTERHGLRVVRWYGFGVKPKIFYRIFGPHFMFFVDSIISKIPGTRFISYDIVFVCKKSQKSR